VATRHAHLHTQRETRGGVEGEAPSSDSAGA
jgi:hypothetical protein